MGGRYRLAVSNCCVEPSCVSDRIGIVDAVRHTDREWNDDADQLVDLAGGPARVQQHQDRGIIRSRDGTSERRRRHDHTLMVSIEFVLEDDLVVVAMAGK